MAKQAGLGDNFYLGGFDLSGDVSSVDKISGGPNLGDVTAIKQSANARLGLLRDGSMGFTTLFENIGTTNTPGVPASLTPVTNTNIWPVFVTVIGGTGTNVSINGVLQGTFDGTYAVPSGGTIALTYTGAPTWNWFAIGAEHNALKTLPRTDVIASYFRGTVLGNPCASINCKQVNYDGTRAADGMLTMQVDLESNGFGLEWGKMLTAGLRTDTTATTGASFDDGAASSFGGQAYFQLIDLVGTSVTIDIQSATTSGGAYATTGLTTTAMSAVGAQRLATTNVTTINEFLKVITTGTFTFAQFAVCFVRNPIAGVVF